MRIGRDIPTEAVSYASLAAGIFGSLGKQAGQAAESAASFLMYNENRADTNYPPRRGEMTVSSYQYIPTPLQEFKPRPKDNYVKPESEKQVIELSR